MEMILITMRVWQIRKGLQNNIHCLLENSNFFKIINLKYLKKLYQKNIYYYNIYIILDLFSFKIEYKIQRNYHIRIVLNHHKILHQI